MQPQKTRYRLLLLLGGVLAACAGDRREITPPPELSFTPQVTGAVYNGAGELAHPSVVTVSLLSEGCVTALDAVAVKGPAGREFSVTFPKRTAPLKGCVRVQSDAIPGETYDDAFAERDGVDFTKPLGIDVRYTRALSVLSFDTVMSALHVIPSDLVVDVVGPKRTLRVFGDTLPRRYGGVSTNPPLTTDTSGVVTYRIGLTHDAYWSFVEVADTVRPDRIFWLSIYVTPNFSRASCFCSARAYPIQGALGTARDSLYVLTSWNPLSEHWVF